MFLADFHLHSTFSDGKLSVREIVDLFGQRGFGAIAITDHLCEESTLLGRAAAYLGRTLTPANFAHYQDVLAHERARAWDRYRMLVIPGFELTRNTWVDHRSAHVLALGVSEWIDASRPVEEQCDAIHVHGGLAIAAHPVSTGRFEPQTLHLWHRREEIAPCFDAWEVASGSKLFPEVRASGLPMLANSDLHRIEQLGSWKNLFPELDRAMFTDADELQRACFAAIRRQALAFGFYHPRDGVERETVWSPEVASLCEVPMDVSEASPALRLLSGAIAVSSPISARVS